MIQIHIKMQKQRIIDDLNSFALNWVLFTNAAGALLLTGGFSIYFGELDLFLTVFFAAFISGVYENLNLYISF